MPEVNGLWIRRALGASGGRIARAIVPMPEANPPPPTGITTVPASVYTDPARFAAVVARSPFGQGAAWPLLLVGGLILFWLGFRERSVELDGHVLEYLADAYGNGRLRPAPGTPGRPRSRRSA